MTPETLAPHLHWLTAAPEKELDALLTELLVYLYPSKDVQNA
jgi:hypothetical protein